MARIDVEVFNKRVCYNEVYFNPHVVASFEASTLKEVRILSLE